MVPEIEYQLRSNNIIVIYSEFGCKCDLENKGLLKMHDDSWNFVKHKPPSYLCFPASATMWEGLECTQTEPSERRPLMVSAMEQLPPSYRRRDEPDFNLREWALKARISRENTKSRRFSASNFTSYREEARSFRSNTTISSAVSSPGYTLRDEIDPSTYSFTSALKALQARSGYGYGWECLSPDGFALNSKWNEAEKYICNPLSGEFPVECLSAKTLSGRSFPTLTSRFTVSGPLVYSYHGRLAQNKPTIAQEDETEFPIQEKRLENLTIDVGTQSTPHDLSSSSPSPASTPYIKERALKQCAVEGGESPNSSPKLKIEEEIEVKESMEEAEAPRKKEERKEEQKGKCRQGGCFSCRSLWRGRIQRGKQRPRWLVLFGKRNISKKVGSEN
ncbi:hypothetical protein NE237_020707 [Protea cynaroides]|uniref:Uncharacterized protein n=1 Tax=Protea cynaroides TaxID=273540 RepID=A0A9Q0K2U5_9MAGN|nr:hypothetical protein NE237_020707 [Protea cynaroides]